MLLPVIVILSLFGAAKVTISHIDHEPKKEWKAMTEEEQHVELRHMQQQHQQWIENGRNQFENIPIQKP